MKIAMFGGSFDPVHNDHVKLCKSMLSEFSLDRVVVFPAACSPFKFNTQTATFHRLNMCRLAFANESKVEVSDFEILKGGKSYTVDTLKHLKEIYPDGELYLIVGADAFMTLDKWYNAPEIFQLAHILTVVRDDDTIEDLQEKAQQYKVFNPRYTLVNRAIGETSSSKIREQLKSGVFSDIDLPTSVFNYIKDNGLYGYGN